MIGSSETFSYQKKIERYDLRKVFFYIKKTIEVSTIKLLLLFGTVFVTSLKVTFFVIIFNNKKFVFKETSSLFFFIRK